MKDFHAGESGAQAGGAALLASGRSDQPEMNRQGFKRFRRKALHRDRHAPLSDVDIPHNLPARIEDEWAQLQLVPPSIRRLEMESAPLVNLHRDDPAAAAFDLLRTRLLQALRDHGWSRIAIAAPTAGCGATFTAVNLALSLARIPGSRTVLMDMNMRAPGIGAALAMPGIGDMRGFLAGEVAVRDQLLRISDTLALGLARRPEHDASERMHDPRTARALERMTTALRPGVVLFDLPPVLAHDDLAAFLPQVDGVLLVSDAASTTAAHIEACERVLDGQSRLLGVVLNRARRAGAGPANA